MSTPDGNYLHEETSARLNRTVSYFSTRLCFNILVNTRRESRTPP
jgi:hypothetical protein